MLYLLAVIAGGYDDYKGFWKQEGKIKPTVFEIKQDGDTYLMVDVFSAENKSIVLSPKDGKLYADGQKEVGLSEDKKLCMVLARHLPN
ncbi:hypothetical protein [Moraxella lacunata]|uniref:hypothetical protein n=1 Tax=Moraxella lacunata TaxID=477 RepID=UPI000E0FE4A8|nr:hypothetical protein [Moraxella lacunata]